MNLTLLLAIISFLELMPSYARPGISAYNIHDIVKRQAQSPSLNTGNYSYEAGSTRVNLQLSIDIADVDQLSVEEIEEKILKAFGCIANKGKCPDGLPTGSPTGPQPEPEVDRDIYDGTNIAAGGESKQSSTSGSNGPDLALDDNKYISVPKVKPNCMIIKADGRSSFEITMKEVYMIRDITLYDSNLQGGLDVEAYFNDTNPGGEEVKCTSPTGVLIPGILELTCDAYLPRASKIRFDVVSHNRSSHDARLFVGICEMDVAIALDDQNVAEGKPVLQSSTFPGNDAEYALDGNFNTLQHTTNEDRFPWWRVDLLVPHVVIRVAIYGRPLYEKRFHDVAIYVSNEDISKLPPKTVFNPGYSSLCLDKIGSEKSVGPKWTTFNCKQFVIGRYLSVQIVADCKPGRTDCNRPDRDIASKHVLHMMEVRVVGQVWENIYPDSDLENVALKKPAMQSSTLGMEGAEFAVDGDYKTLQHNYVSDRFPWWRVDLEKPYLVEQVIVYNRDGQNHLRFHDVTIRVSNQDISEIPEKTIFDPKDGSICAEGIGAYGPVPAGKNFFSCITPILGRYVSLQIVKDCKEGWGSRNVKCNVDGNLQTHILHVAEVEVIALWKQQSLMGNVAHMKPTKQSSTDESFAGNHAVDGSFHTFQKTATNDYFAWWQVDLGPAHLVVQVTVYIGDGEARLLFHDVTIRVTNKDIGKRQEKVVFDPKDDSICVEDIAADGPLPVGKNLFDCQKTIIGKYVSLQIVKDCKKGWGIDNETCNVDGSLQKHILQVAEVQVLGMQWMYSNQRRKGSALQISNANSWKEFNKQLLTDGDSNPDVMTVEDKATCSTTDIYAAGQFPWWRVDLKKEHKVKQVIIKNRGAPLDVLLHDIQIRVGNEDISNEDTTNQIWDKNSLCAEDNFFLKPGKNVLNCTEEVKGQFVSIQITKRCVEDKCFLYDTNVLSLCDVVVIGDV